jgi:histidine triad (HIT) family protein
MLCLSHMKDTNCLFCKIVAGEIPCEKVYEDENTLAFLDIKPVNPGHTLIVPKEHYENVFEAPEEVWGHVMQTVKKVSHAIKDGLPVADLNIAMNNGKHAGQVIFHAHVHVMPRYENDGFELWHGKDYAEGQAKVIAEKIKKVL